MEFYDSEAVQRIIVSAEVRGAEMMLESLEATFSPDTRKIQVKKAIDLDDLMATWEQKMGRR